MGKYNARIGISGGTAEIKRELLWSKSYSPSEEFAPQTVTLNTVPDWSYFDLICIIFSSALPSYDAGYVTSGDVWIQNPMPWAFGNGIIYADISIYGPIETEQAEYFARRYIRIAGANEIYFAPAYLSINNADAVQNNAWVRPSQIYGYFF